MAIVSFKQKVKELVYNPHKMTVNSIIRHSNNHNALEKELCALVLTHRKALWLNNN